MRETPNHIIPQTFQIAKRYIYLMTHDSTFANALDHQISHFGYSLRVINTIYELDNVITEHASLAYLVDMDSIDLDGLDVKFLDAIKNRGNSEIPLIFISETNNQAIRLKGIRAGGKAFFPSAW